MRKGRNKKVRTKEETGLLNYEENGFKKVKKNEKKVPKRTVIVGQNTQRIC